MKISQTSLIIILCSVLAVFLFVFVVLRTTSYFDIKKVNITHSDNVEVLPEKMTEELDSLKGMNLFKISDSSIKKHFEAYEFVNSVEIKRYYPSELDVNIVFEPMIIKVCTSDNVNVSYYLADEKGLYPSSSDMFFYYSKLPEVIISQSYANSLISSAPDNGYVQMVTLAGALKSNNLITTIKYDNNNLNDFGRLSIYLSNKGVLLKVMEPVEPSRLLEALDLVEFGDYELYSGTMVRRGQEDSIGIR